MAAATAAAAAAFVGLASEVKAEEDGLDEPAAAAEDEDARGASAGKRKLVVGMSSDDSGNFLKLHGYQDEVEMPTKKPPVVTTHLTSSSNVPITVVDDGRSKVITISNCDYLHPPHAAKSRKNEEGEKVPETAAMSKEAVQKEAAAAENVHHRKPCSNDLTSKTSVLTSEVRPWTAQYRYMLSGHVE